MKNDIKFQNRYEISGVPLWLTQDAYVTGTDELYYIASAIDSDGNDYIIIWDIIKSVDTDDDEEGDACDWSVYTVIAID